MWGTMPRSTSAPAEKERLFFANDYQEGAHPLLLEALTSHNLTPAPGYGLDPWCESARAKLRAACGAPEAVHFLVGGTKCGALLGEAVVLPRPERLPHFFTAVKQRGALLAKGRVLGLQFDRLFTDGLYLRIGASAVALAGRIRRTLAERGYEMPPTRLPTRSSCGFPTGRWSLWAGGWPTAFGKRAGRTTR